MLERTLDYYGIVLAIQYFPEQWKTQDITPMPTKLVMQDQTQQNVEKMFPNSNMISWYSNEPL